ncbi:MAG: glycosyltransferase family 4 protein [Chloroflexi bacterium]|jgi:glycosyltransferase involved in cell wall biosynthesis|nr:glycosyltransferase family 4 protein [Chloroflexota bacterium]
MRVVVITSWATDVISGSGTAVFFNAFLAGLRERGYEVEVIAPNFDTADYIEATLKRFLFNTELRTEPRLREADVIIGFDYDGYGLDPAQRPPLIASAHAIFGDLHRWEREPIRTIVHAQAFFDRVNMQRADLVTAGSQYAKDQIVRLYGVPAEKVQVIPHGMLTPSWLPLVDAEPRQPNPHPIVLAIGKFYPRKRVDVLLRAIPLLIDEFPDLEVRIVGNGLEWDALHALADELKVNAHVTWLSHITDDVAFAREWRQADVFCHPSCQESFGYVYLEAMTLGKPIVAARASAAPEVVGEAGLLVEPENPAALAEGIRLFLRDEALRAEFGRRGRARAQLFTMARMIDGYEAAIRKVTAAVPAR